MQIKYSVLIPFYNGSKYIQQTLMSIINQDYENIEIVIVNDASSLKEKEFLLNLLLEINDSRINVHHNQNNLGLMESLNQGLKLLSSEYLILLGQDDLISKEHIKGMNKLIGANENKYSAIFCDAIYMSNDYVTDRKVRGSKILNFKNDELQFENLMRWNYIVSTGICINVNVLKNVGGFEINFRNHGEWLTWLKIAKVQPIKINKKIFSFYRRHINNITNEMYQNDFYLTYKYYQYVNNYAYEMSSKSIYIKFMFSFNYIKNIMLLLYKKMFKFSRIHRMVLKK